MLTIFIRFCFTGFPHWPCKIKSFPSDRHAEVVWFNDYRKTKIFRTQMFKFLPNFHKYAEKFDDCIGLKTADENKMEPNENKMDYGITNSLYDDDSLFSGNQS